MKKLYFFLILACAPFIANAEGGCSVQVQPQNCFCFGDCSGSAMAMPTGSSPFVYTWLPGGQTTQTINNLCPGSYTVIVTDANNCTSTESFIITEPTQISVATSVTNESCMGCCDGFITSNVQGGTPAYTYFWVSPTQTTPTYQAACSGTYTLCVTDMNGCMSCNTATVSFNTGLAEQPENGSLSVFPVPATSTVNIQQTFTKPLSAEIRLTNVLGEMVFSRSESEGMNLNIELNVSVLPAGVYLVSVITSEGTSVRRIIKE
jgi:hypothetical protein